MIIAVTEEMFHGPNNTYEYEIDIELTETTVLFNRIKHPVLLSKITYVGLIGRVYGGWWATSEIDPKFLNGNKLEKGSQLPPLCIISHIRLSKLKLRLRMF